MDLLTDVDKIKQQIDVYLRQIAVIRGKIEQIREYEMETRLSVIKKQQKKDNT